ncbi:hypothetical protein V6N13_109508 [Hibiscus sabdariffa]
MTSRYQSNPGEGHWVAIKNILKYLRRTKDTFPVYGGEEELSIKGYIDVSFQTNKDDSQSQSGFVFYLNGGALSWKRSKQDTVADSKTVVEYIAASEAIKEALWIKKFISELGVIPSISCSVELRFDNNGAIVQAKERRSHQRSKHILRRFHLIRDIMDRGDLEICKFRNLRIVLKQERKEHVIEEPVPDEPAANAPRADKDKFKKYMDDMVAVGCLMLSTIDSELQKQHENMVAFEMIQNLKEIYEGQARQERYETSKALFQCKMTEGTPVGAHVIKMMGYVQTLEKLGFSLKE